MTLEEEKAKEEIEKILTEEAGKINVIFDPQRSQVIIEAEKPGLVIGKAGEILKEIKHKTLWTPLVRRIPAIRSKMIENIRKVLYENNDYRRNFLNKWNKEKADDSLKTEQYTSIEIDDVNKDGKPLKVKKTFAEAATVAGVDMTTPDSGLTLNQKNAKKEFLSRWAEGKAQEHLEKEADLKFSVLQNQAESGDPNALPVIQTLALNHLRDLQAVKSDERIRIGADKMSDDEIDLNTKRLEIINKEMVVLLKKIADAQFAGTSTAMLENDKKRLEVEASNARGVLNSSTGEYDLNHNAFVKRKEEDKEKLMKKVTDEEKKYKVSADVITALPSERKAMKAEADRLAEIAKEHKENENKLQEKIEKKTPPRAFYADRERRSLEDEERRKINTDDSDELVAAFKDALRQGDLVRGTAIYKKLAADGNDNELLNEFGFDSGRQGMHDFFNAVMIGDKKTKKGQYYINH